MLSRSKGLCLYIYFHSTLYTKKTAPSRQKAPPAQIFLPISVSPYYLHLLLSKDHSKPAKISTGQKKYAIHTRQRPPLAGKRLHWLKFLCLYLYFHIIFTFYSAMAIPNGQKALPPRKRMSYVLAYTRQIPLLNGKKLRLPQFLLPIFVFPYYHTRKGMPYYVLPYIRQIPLLAGSLWRPKIFHICISINWRPCHFIFTWTYLCRYVQLGLGTCFCHLTAHQLLRIL